ncbi:MULTISPECIES: sulfite reductase subunit C [Fusobacterium]|uniref:sulfite reductase subunit C n=1 Tax=Fusobacterium TaxID=848 RepID=UPI001032D0E2|nr:sulfite reductase subunit C [Fusobacterium ulcerans]
MKHDMNINKLKLNCFRQSKVPGEFMLQMRVPGGLVKAKYLSTIQYIAETWGNGTFHLGMRQTLNAPGIKYESIPEVNKYLEEYIKDIEVEMCNVDMDVNEAGYPTIGARNIMACIGNSHCIKANINTFELAKKIEKEIFPSHYHIKIAIAGCPNDCAKGHFNDFGILGVTKPIYLKDRCIGCGRCVKVCEHAATRVLKLVNNKIEKDSCCCVGCGECVEACPASAWVRPTKKLYRVLIGGRTGKQYPRMGKMFLNWVTEDVVIKVIQNWQNFSANVLHHKPVYLHGGHLIDRAGYAKFKDLILKDVELNPEALVAQRVLWAETEYRANINLRAVKDIPSPGEDYTK